MSELPWKSGLGLGTALIRLAIVARRERTKRRTQAEVGFILEENEARKFYSGNLDDSNSCFFNFCFKVKSTDPVLIQLLI